MPVMWTEKRYVRKPRGSKPGTAVCLRGKTLFVTPRLPGQGPDGQGSGAGVGEDGEQGPEGAGR